ncbi:MAG TPA: FAD-binding protein, partial [Paracoccaceae bacterium]
QTPTIQVAEGVIACGLDLRGGRVAGVVVEAADGGSGRHLLRGRACLLAGGGSGGLYALTTNPPRIRGQVIGLAARAGAVIADAEFVQFHPTAIDIGEDPAPLATEALRGEGATLINRDGHRFMPALHPDAELAPRDVVARAIFAQTQAGLHPMLDCRAAIGTGMAQHFPAVTAACRRAGIDPAHQPIPVAAAAHYHMGGIEVSVDGRASLPGLWVCGEAAATGLHGANRLASNGLLEALVYGRRAARDIAAGLGEAAPAAPVSFTLPPGRGGAAPELVARLRQVMTEHVGVVRSAAGLETALRRIAALEAAAGDCASFANMTATATLIAAAALLRRETRGAHCRSDFPDADPDLAHRSRLTLADALTLRQSVTEIAA